MSTSTVPVTVSRFELGMLAVYSLRDALQMNNPRSTVGVIIEAIRNHWDDLSNDDHTIIIRDLKQAISMPQMAKNANAKEWEQFVDWLSKKNT